MHARRELAAEATITFFCMYESWHNVFPIIIRPDAGFIQNKD
jgi:hypothetical protein|tara:strand:+ start:1246 stop:1371 length:126 start_codon:yes stop_codon:yes gene_type:complete